MGWDGMVMNLRVCSVYWYKVPTYLNVWWCAVGCLLLQIYSKVIQVHLLLKGSLVGSHIPRLN